MTNSKGNKVTTYDLTKQEFNLPATTGNPFAEYGRGSGSKIQGQLLKFTKGEWLAGQDNKEIEEGTEFIVNMDQVLIGWQRWEDNRPAEQVMGLLSKGYKAPDRSSLGHDDQRDWEPNPDGTPKDPWQKSNLVLMKGVEDGELYTFATQSGTGIWAIKELCEKYGEVLFTRPDEYPIVSIHTKPWKHVKFGRMHKPEFKIVGWASKAEFENTEPESTKPEAGFKGRRQKAR